MPNPSVSVIILTYNQQSTISQTLDSILSQITNFPYEVVIGDDNSSDDTRKICIQYADKYSNIKLIDEAPNLGIVRNYVRAIGYCEGQYVAVCAGDDYWIDNKKLQKQFEFLQNNPKFGITFSRVKTLFTDGSFEDQKPVEEWVPVTNQADYLLLVGNFLNAPSAMYRASILKDAVKQNILKEDFLMEDYPIFLFASEKYQIGASNDLTAVWRRNAESASVTTDVSKELKFMNAVGEIREFFAMRWNRADELRPVIAMWYRALLVRAAQHSLVGYKKLFFNKIRRTGYVKIYDYALLLPFAPLLLKYKKNKSKLSDINA